MHEDSVNPILTDIKSIQLSLLQKGEEKKDNKSEYFKKKTAKFVLPHDFPRTDEYFATLLHDMYDELLEYAPEDVDSLGLWVEYDTITFDNAMTLDTLESIKMYSSKNPEDELINVAYEFFKMTLPPLDYFSNNIDG